MIKWIDIERKRGARDRCASDPVPERLPMLGPEHSALLQRWVRSDGARRGRSALLNEAGPTAIERAEELCERLLKDGWVVRHEELVGGVWQWSAITWRDLPRLQVLLGVSSPRQRVAQRQALLEQADAWLQERCDNADTNALDPDLLDELIAALAQLRQDKTLRIDLLGTRIKLLNALCAWHDADAQGTRRDFALKARGATKAMTDADWRWLETAFDLERLRIARFAPLAWLAGNLALQWGEHSVNISPLHCMGLPLADLFRAESVSQPIRWWLIENRASFERQAQNREPGTALVWMPGRPSTAWLDTVDHLLELAPAPAWISADADPAGVDIARTVGALWQSRRLTWEPYQMGVAQWEATSQNWPLNKHDRSLLTNLLATTDLPLELHALCKAMQVSGRKAEQEAWI